MRVTTGKRESGWKNGTCVLVCSLNASQAPRRHQMRQPGAMKTSARLAAGDASEPVHTMLSKATAHQAGGDRSTATRLAHACRLCKPRSNLHNTLPLPSLAHLQRLGAQLPCHPSHPTPQQYGLVPVLRQLSQVGSARQDSSAPV